MSPVATAEASVKVTSVPLAETELTPRVDPFTRTVNALAGAVVADSLSLKVRSMIAPLVEVTALTNVGRTPSTLWVASAATAACVMMALIVVEPFFRIVPPFSSSSFAAISMPSVSSSLSATT